MSESRALLCAGGEPEQAPVLQRRAGRGATSLVLGLSVLVAGLVALTQYGRHHREVAHGAVGEEVTRLDDVCDEYPYLKYEVPNAVTYNNLANKGPDKGHGEGLVYKTIDLGAGAGDELDKEVYMTINATASSNYKPFSPRLNGMQGKYGSINLQSGSEVDLLFNFYDTETLKKLTLPEFAMTWFDLDTGDGGHSAEYVIIGGFKSHHVTGSGGIKGETEVKIEKQPDGRTKFRATTVGTGEDNPLDPNFLTAQQKNRAVTLLFGATETVHVTLGATAGKGPRFFTFVGRPSLLCAVTVQENFVPPLDDLTYAPPMEDAVYVQSHETLVALAVKKGDEVEEGDLIATTKTEGGASKEYRAQHDGTVTKLQDELKPGDKCDERLSEKIIAVVERPTLKPLPLEGFDVPGGPGEDAGLPSQTIFKKYLVKPGDRVKKGDPIALVEKGEGGEEVEVKAADYGVVKKRQEEMRDGMLLEAVLDKNLVTLSPFPALPTGEGSVPAAQLPGQLAEERTFVEYKVKKGDIVKQGDPIAMVKTQEGSEEDVPAEKGGVVSGLQEDLPPGTPLDRLEDGNLATVGKFPPLPVESGMSPVGIKGSGAPAPPSPSEADMNPTPEPLSVPAADTQDQINPLALKFVKYYVEPEDVVETGDPMVQVQDIDGERHDILAPKPGAVKYTQDGLKDGMILENVMQDQNLVTIDRLPALDVGPGQTGSFAPAGENWELKEWRVEEGDDVSVGDPIAALEIKATGAKMDVLAGKAGTVGTKQKLKPGDVVEQCTRDNNLANINWKGPSIGFGEVGVDVPSMDCHFLDWRVSKDQYINFGDPIADVQCPPSRRLSSAGSRRMLGEKPFSIPSPGMGWINYMADLKPGQTILESAASPTIAKVHLAWPWWLTLLVVLCGLCCCCLGLLALLLLQSQQAAPKPAPAPAALAVAPVVGPDGLRLDFDDNGTTRTVYAKYRPLGIHHCMSAPIVVHDFTVNSYAKQQLGLQIDWKLVRIENEELNDSSDFDAVNAKLNSYLKQLPIWPLPLEFRKEPDDRETHTFSFVERPLGIEFCNVAPIAVEKVHPGSPAFEQNVGVGWCLTKIGDQDVHESQSFREVLVYLKEAAQGLDDTRKQYTTPLNPKQL